MLLNGYHIIALILALPGLFALTIGTWWSFTVIKALKNVSPDGLSEFVGGMSKLFLIIVIMTFSISCAVFGATGLLYATAFFSVFTIPAVQFIIE